MLKHSLLVLFLSLIQVCEASGVFSYTQRDGLGSNTIDAIVQDQEGYFYFATNGGLSVFDGNSFHTYNYQNINSFSNSITTLVALGDSIVLIGSRDKGLFLLDKTTDNIRPVFFYNVVLSNISSLELTKNNELWIGTPNQGLFYLSDCSFLSNPDNNEIKLSYVEYPFPAIYSMTSIGDHLFIASHSNVLFIVTRTKNTFSIEKKLLDLNITSIYSLASTADNDLWIGTNCGISILSNQKDKGWSIDKKIALPTNPIRTISLVGDVAYAAVEGYGLYEINLQTLEFVKRQDIGAKNVISSYVENDNSIWFGSWNEGLFRLIRSNQSFQEIPYLKDNNRNNIVWNISTPSLGKTPYLMTNGMGLCVYNEEAKVVETLSNDYPYVFSAMPKVGSNLIYVGTWGEGLKLFDLDRRKYLQNDNYRKLDGSRVFCVDRARADQLLIGAYPCGAFVLDERTNELEHLNFPDSLGGLNVRKFAPCPQEPNYFWMATFNAGLFKIQLSPEGNLLNYTKVNSFEKGEMQIENMLVDNDRLWLCLSDGLAFLDITSNEDLVYREPTLSGTHCKAIYPVGNNKYWLATLSGLIYFDGDEQSIKRFFVDKSFYSLSQTNNSNTLLVGGSNGLALCRVDELLAKSSQVKAVIRSLSINGNLLSSPMSKQELTSGFNKAINYSDTLRLASGRQTLTFILSSLVLNPELNPIIYYKIEGIDNKWNYVSGEHATAIYSSFPVGTYELIVRVNDFDNLEGEKRLIIIKSDYWWNLWWARALQLLLIISFILTLVLYQYRKRIRRQIRNLEETQREELYQQRMRFFTNMSHDLKTPLTLLLTPLEDMSEDPEVPEKFKQRLNSMVINGQQLLSRINKTLNYRNESFLEDSLKYDVYDIRQLVYQIITPFKEYAERQSIVFNVTYPQDNTHHIKVDFAKFESILENLVSNAIKYTSESGKVEIEYEVLQDNLVLRVSDTGVGIPEDQQQHIYDRYYRLTDDSRGTGIGLYTVKQYLDLLGGTIKLESKESKGSCFTISLPLNTELSVDGLEAESDESITSLQSSEYTLVVVDDNKEIRDYLYEIFSPIYNVVLINNGSEALDVITALIPDLVITDLLMPQVNGLELSDKLKSNVSTSHIPIIMLSAKDTEETRSESLRLGVDLFETKPFNKKLLMAKVDSLLKNRRLLKYKYKLEESSRLASSVVISSKDSLDEEFIKLVNQTIEACSDNAALSVHDIAQRISLTPDQLSRKLKALTGISTNQYIRSYRLNMAAALLRTKKYMVTEVLYQVGFNNPSYFTKCFKAEFGVSPSEYLTSIDEMGDETEKC